MNNNMPKTLGKKYWNPLVTFLRSNQILLFYFLLSGTAQAGGGYDGPYLYIDDKVHIIPSKLLNSTFHRPYNFAIEHRDQTWTEMRVLKETNLQEWSDFLNTDKELTEQYIYHAENLQELPQDVQEYLEFVHKTQHLVDHDGYYDRITSLKQSPKELKDTYRNVINDAEQLMKQTSSSILQMRWLYLMIRLAHYSEQFALEGSLYRRYGPSIRNEAQNSEIWFWIDALLAGRTKRMAKTHKDKARAAYQFALIFHNSESKRVEAYHNFSIKTDEEWSELMNFCKVPEEKAMMYFIRALDTDANTLEELKNIIDVAPNSRWAQELLAWELESSQYPIDWMYEDKEVYQTTRIADNLQQRFSPSEREHLQDFRLLVDSIIEKQIQSDLFLAEFVQYYLRLLEGEKITRTDFRSFRNKYSTDPRIQYVDGFEFLIYLFSLETVDESVEEEIASYLNWIEEADDLHIYSVKPIILLTLEPLYLESFQMGKLLYAYNQGSIRLDSLTYEELQIYVTFLQKPRNKLWKYLLQYTYNTDEFQLTMGMKFIENQNYEAALEVLEPLDVVLQSYTNYNPFMSSLRGNNRTSSMNTGMNILTFVKEILRLKEELRMNKDNVDAHFRLGNAMYNITWFGNSPQFVRHNRSVYSWSDGVIDLNAALFHYKKALRYASTDEEKAEILYALAKVEFTETQIRIDKKSGYSMDYIYEYEFEDAILKLQEHGFGRYFKKLKKYPHTEYYKNVVQDCAVYNYGKW